MTATKRTKRNARKAHRCHYCNDDIAPGTVYERWVWFGEGSPIVFKVHAPAGRCIPCVAWFAPAASDATPCP